MDALLSQGKVDVDSEVEVSDFEVFPPVVKESVTPVPAVGLSVCEAFIQSDLPASSVIALRNVAERSASSQRSRASSTGTISKYFTKKRKNLDESSVTSSPKRYSSTDALIVSAISPVESGPEHGMEKLLQDVQLKFDTMMKEFGEFRKENKVNAEQLAVLTKNSECCTMELHGIRQELKARDADWQRIKSTLEERISLVHRESSNNMEELKSRMDLLEKKLNVSIPSTSRDSDTSLLLDRLDRLSEVVEKDRRKYNIIIKGAFFNTGNLKSDAELFLQDVFGPLPHIVDRAWSLGLKSIRHNNNKSAYGVRVSSLDIKRTIMKNKSSKLKGKDIYIENDSTMRERSLAKKLRDIARAEREAGRNVLIRYNRISIDGAWHRLDGKSGELERSRSPRAREPALLDSSASKNDGTMS